ncbi:hypothetical protein QYF36_012937 [Acer negundo]|nr:hypothetical protein QYF36_012937 [Acer negundo]
MEEKFASRRELLDRWRSIEEEEEQFSTLVEAERVAKLTNGMHVYSCPIISNLVDLDWSRRGEHARGSSELRKRPIVSFKEEVKTR